MSSGGHRHPRRRRHLPWAVPAALGAVLGSALATAPEPWLTPGWLLTALLALALLVPAAARHGGPAWARWALVCGLAAVAVGGRGLAWSAAVDPWQQRLGQTLTLTGSSDGRLLIVPGEGRLVLKGAAVAPGEATLRGELVPLARRRNPGGFDEAGFWRRRGIRAGLRVETVVARAPPGGLLAARAALQAGVVAGLEPRAAAVQQAVTLGLRHDLGTLRGLFAAAGMAHLLALSGLHVGVLAAAVGALARPLGPRLGGAAVASLVAGYVLLVGPGPSVVRAASMVAAVLLARALDVRAPPLTASLAVAALACLLAAPAWVGDLGFQLSFLSVLGIAVLAGPALRSASEASTAAPASGAGGGVAHALRTRRFGRWLVAGLVASAAAQAGSLSVVAGAFGSLPLLAPLVNLVALPAASALVPLGALAGLAGLAHPALAHLVNAFAAPLAAGLLALADAASRVPPLPWGEVGPEGHVLYACALLALALALRGRLRWRSALLVLACAASVAWLLPDARGVPELIVLDVGQGDAVVVRLGRGRAVLVDGGGVTFGGFDSGARVVVPALRALGVWQLPLVVATHADLDHMGGLPAVLEAFAVGELWLGHAEPERPVWQRLEAIVRRRGVAVREVRRGEAVAFGDLRIDVLHPTHRPHGEGNADSVALLLWYRGAPWALLLGDVPALVEADLPVPPTPVLMAPHHGSATSTSAALLRAAGPELVLISVGSNRYGHPAAEVLARLEAARLPVLTTHHHGALRVRPGRACAEVEMSRPGGGVAGAC